MTRQRDFVPNPKRPETVTASNSKRLKNLALKSAPHFSNQTSTWQPKVFVKTFGCQMNSRDTEMIYGGLIERGYGVAGSAEEADVVLFNTCSVRGHAEERVWGQVGMLSKLNASAKGEASVDRQRSRQRRGLPKAARLKVIGVVGCMAQNYKEKIFERLPYVNLVCGTGNIYEIGDFIDRLTEGKEDRILAVDREQRPESLNGSGAGYREGGIKAYVSIMEGCDNFCSYCIVPYVRGRERSRKPEGILKEIRELAERGFKEVTLLGQNVNSYKSQVTSHKSQVINFVKLLEEIDKINGIERVRFTTSHPKDVSGDLFRAIRDLPSLCEYLHLPLQAGSDKILKLMNRGYQASDYLKLVENLRKIIPTAGIATDIIVGFPGERKEDFDKTCRVLEEAKFDSVFIFKYSPRPPAASSKLKDDVPREEKEERNRILLELQGRISREKNQRLVGNFEEVLVEGKSKKSEMSQLVGRTRTNKIVVFEGGEDLSGKLVRVKIEIVTPHTLIGVIDNEN